MAAPKAFYALAKIFGDVSLSLPFSNEIFRFYPPKARIFLGYRGGRTRGGWLGGCIASTFATKSIIDSTRTRRAMNQWGHPHPRRPLPPAPPAPSIRRGAIVARLEL